MITTPDIETIQHLINTIPKPSKCTGDSTATVCFVTTTKKFKEEAKEYYDRKKLYDVKFNFLSISDPDFGANICADLVFFYKVREYKESVYRDFIKPLIEQNIILYNIGKTNHFFDIKYQFSWNGEPKEFPFRFENF